MNNKTLVFNIDDKDEARRLFVTVIPLLNESGVPYGFRWEGEFIYVDISEGY